MANTIELLESIGKNASLRHASGAELEKMLDEMQASNELKRAANTGDAEHLKQELGGKSMGVNNSTPNGGCLDEDEKDLEDDDADDEKKS